MKLNILGVEYTLITDGTSVEFPDLTDDSDGYCNFQSKQIVISKEYDDKTSDYAKYLDAVVRHEVVHAYLYESGLHDYANDELIVDWIALQFPKMKKLFEELNI